MICPLAPVAPVVEPVVELEEVEVVVEDDDDPVDPDDESVVSDPLLILRFPMVTLFPLLETLPVPWRLMLRRTTLSAWFPMESVTVMCTGKVPLRARLCEETTMALELEEREIPEGSPCAWKEVVPVAPEQESGRLEDAELKLKVLGTFREMERAPMMNREAIKMVLIAMEIN